MHRFKFGYTFNCSGPLRISSDIHFCNSSALRVALLGFLFSWKCFTGGVRGPTRVVNALLLRYWHSSGSMVDASHSLTNEKRKLRDDRWLYDTY